jgi:hypothetical protein
MRRGHVDRIFTGGTKSGHSRLSRSLIETMFACPRLTNRPEGRCRSTDGAVPLSGLGLINP